MMKKKLITCCLLFCFVLLVVNACIRDEIKPCPPLTVDIEVTDKNYFNIHAAEIEEAMPENLPFGRYIPAIRYMLRDASTGAVIEEQELLRVEDSTRNLPITFCDCIPHGTYILTVWGGRSEAFALDRTAEHLILHPENMEGDDIYLTRDTLVYDATHYHYTVGMERVKGKMLVLFENLPTQTTRIEERISGIFGEVSSSFEYTGETATGKSTNSPQLTGKSATLSAPSVAENASIYTLRMYNESGELLEESQHPLVKITMKRNELTLLRYSYGQGNKCLIQLFVNDHWEVIHGMDID